MKKLLNLTLFSTVLLLVGCNEKISPELQDAASSSTVPTIVPPSEYFFAVNNVSSYLLNYKLHKTGRGNATIPCETRKNTPLSNDFYKNGADTASDITCFLEAEELALWHGGFELEVSASKNTCEYIGYAPFSYYNRMPGNSSTTLVQVACSGNVLVSEIASRLSTLAEINGGTHTSCNTYVDQRFPAATRGSFTAADDERLCNFNYQDRGKEKCDVGEIKVIKYTLSKDATTNAVTMNGPEERIVKCGGKHYNCVAGPIRDITQKKAYVTQIYNTERNAGFSQKFSYEPPSKTEFPGTFGIANYRRDLSSVDLDYGDARSRSLPYMGAFSDEKDYSPVLMDRYSNNKKMDNQTLITETDIADWSYTRNNPFTPTIKFATAVPWAAEPFLGLYGLRTNPFYSFYCLDAAKDIKARIRIVVRDWDRTFPSGDVIELISDINLSTNSYMDVYAQEEIPDDQDDYNDYNDFSDWDDLIYMSRTPGIFDAQTTTWRPSPLLVPISIYPFGFFNKGFFPATYKEE